MKFTKHTLLSFCTTLNITIFLLTIIVSAKGAGITTSTKNNNVFISKCTNFTDNRRPLQDQIIAYNSERQSVTLQLQEGDSHILKCDVKKTKVRSVSWKNEKLIPKLGRRNFNDVSNGSSARHQHSYFTEMGYFYDKTTGNYYKSDGDFCVKSIYDDGVDLLVCAANNDCSSTSIPNSYCLPKCCALDETLAIEKWQCVRLPETRGRTPWEPLIYQAPNKPRQMVSNHTNIIYHMAQLPQECYVTITKNAYNQTSRQNVYMWLSRSEEDDVKLVLPPESKNGKNVQFMSLYYDSRKWIPENYDNFCVEGFYDKSKEAREYTRNPDDFVVFYCPNKGINSHSDYLLKDPKWKSWTYAVASLLAVVFLLATIFVYLILWDTHNLHGLTILSYTVSTFGSYLSFAVAHILSLNQKSNMSRSQNRDPFCYAIAICAHFFFLSSHLYLTVMNFDLWITLKSMRVVSKNAKEWSKFGAYSVVALIFPALLIIAFVVVDEVYRHPRTEVPVPDYAMTSCFVSPDFRGEYVYAPMGIILVINVVLIGMTMWIFIQARRRSATTFNTGNGANAKKYNAKLFGKLFLVMGGASVVYFLTWYYNNKGYKPWLIVALEVISYFTPVALFILFCLNDKVIGQLKERFPQVAVPKVVKKKRDVRSGHSSNMTSSQTNMCTLDTIDGTEVQSTPVNTAHK